jgi:NTP pyrophosphatase (non-canonical NTP hydrolase)
MILTSHFSALTEAEQERLAILIEECGEVVQAACKVLRHGYDSDNNGKLPETNRKALEREIGDLCHAVRRMQGAADVDALEIMDRALSKPERILPYLHHQGAA